MTNRLKIVRKVKNKTQEDVANFLHVKQNTYSYWETGKVKIDYSYLEKLSVYYSIDVRFLAGIPYSLRNPIKSWRHDQQEDYYRANPDFRSYIEYLFGDLEYIDSPVQSEPTSAMIETSFTTVNGNNNIIGNGNTVGNHLTEQERALLELFGKMDVIKQAQLLAFAADLVN